MSTPPPLEKRPIRRLYRYGLKHRGRLLAGFLLGVLGGGSIFGMLASLSKTANKAFASDQVEGTLEALISSDSGFLVTALLLILFFLLSGLGNYFSIYHINWVGFKVVEELRRESFHKLQVLQLGFYSRHSSGELISRITNDTMQVQHAVSGVVADIVRQPLTLIAALAFMLMTDPVLALLSLVIFPICVAPVIIFGRKVRKYSRQSQEYLAGLSSVLQENVSGTRVVKAFGMEAYEEEKFDRENRSVFGRLIKTVLARNINQPLMEFVAGLGIVAMMMYVRVRHLEVGDFFAFAAALGMLYQPAKMLSKVHMEIQKAMGAAERIFSLLDEPIDVVEAPDALDFNEDLREIRFENVGFDYGDKPVLRNVNLTIRAGETVALVGSSGSGKSTLVSLVPRFYDPTRGRLCLNDHDLPSLSLKSLREHVALVTQDTFLFDDTIASNIAYGREDAVPEAIIAAARKANAHDFIQQLPKGYDTKVGERGGNLSGGQRQRIAIARAIYRDAPILILDEATSALDNESERLVQEAINTMMKGRTSIVIAHRLSTIQHADRILVLQEGQIVEQGSHTDLLKQNGIYKHLYQLQFQNA
ncbi:MAG: ATP-binding cassette domain-containing protein [Verrucomicrobia bacterium]|nr:ATP-binding cassette domain-containing protein [Verrucomicrobiota bacterium]